MALDDVTFPKDTQFLVTGVAGFIGSNLVESLLSRGHRVRGLDNLSTGKIENIRARLTDPHFEFVQGDIRQFGICIEACKGVDYVLHQAALGSVPRSISEPLIYEDNNIKGTSNMMEAARLAGVRRFVYASSSSVYGSSDKLPKVEGEEGQVLSPYALTKLVNEQYGRLYTQLYGLECIGLRYFNVFGRRQDPDSQYAAVIPRFIKSLVAGESVVIHGDGNQTRDFTYIDNVVQANLRSCLASSEACGRAFNIACGDNCSVNQMYQMMCEQLGIDRAAIHTQPRDGDIRHSLASIEAAKSLLGYRPDWSFRAGFVEAIKWYLTGI